jgi:hypothetical protein
LRKSPQPVSNPSLTLKLKRNWHHTPLVVVVYRRFLATTNTEKQELTDFPFKAARNTFSKKYNPFLP